MSKSFALTTDNDGAVCVFWCVCVSGGLDAQVGERGKSFSVGQRQLLCLARALLTRAKVRASEQRPAISVGRIIQLVFPHKLCVWTSASSRFTQKKHKYRGGSSYCLVIEELSVIIKSN